jgi:putative transposase
MKGKRFTTEDKVRILREADREKSIGEVCQAHNISEVTFHRWKKDLGMMSIPEARRLKDLEQENSEPKKMLAEALLAKRVLEVVCEKNCKPGAPAADGQASGGGRLVFWAGGLSDFKVTTGHVLVSRTAGHAGRGATKDTVA